MLLAQSVFLQLIPLYLSVMLGFIAGRWLTVEGRSLAMLCFYIFAPLAIFSGVLRLGDIPPQLFMLPLLVYLICCGLCLTTLHLGHRLWQRDGRANMAAFSAGLSNYGSFGLPVAILLFDDRTIGLYIFAGLGIAVYRSTLGFYIAAQGAFSAREALFKTLRLPILYALLAGVGFHAAGVHMPQPVQQFFTDSRTAFGIIGMLLIGVSIAQTSRISDGHGFVGLLLVNKYLVWPALMIGLIALDRHVLGWLPPEAYPALMLLAICPLAINTVVVAHLLNAHPEKAATALLISTFVSLIYVPLMAAWFIL